MNGVIADILLMGVIMASKLDLPKAFFNILAINYAKFWTSRITQTYYTLPLQWRTCNFIWAKKDYTLRSIAN